MKVKTVWAAAMAIVLGASLVMAANKEELTSGPEPGEGVGAFDVTKCAGNANDGVAIGEELCYRCKMGSRPVVMIFARESDKELAKLVKELDKAVVKHEDAKLVTFVNLLGKDQKALSQKAKDFIKETKVENVAVVVPMDQEGTEEQFHINKDAQVTVVLYNKNTVKASHALNGEVTAKIVDQIVKEAAEMVGAEG